MIMVWWVLFFDCSLLVSNSWFVGLTIGLSPRFVLDFEEKFCDPALPPSFGGTWLVIPCEEPIMIPFCLSCTGLAEPPLFGTLLTYWFEPSLPGPLSFAYFTLSFENFWLTPAFFECAEALVIPELLTAWLSPLWTRFSDLLPIVGPFVAPFVIWD